MTHINAYYASVQEAEEKVKAARAELEDAKRLLDEKKAELGVATVEEAKDIHEETPVDQKAPVAEGRPSQEVEKAAKTSKK